MLIAFETKEENRFNIFSTIEKYFDPALSQGGEAVCGVTWCRNSPTISADIYMRLSDITRIFFTADKVSSFEFTGVDLVHMGVGPDFINGDDYLQTFSFFIAVRKLEYHVPTAETIFTHEPAPQVQ